MTNLNGDYPNKKDYEIKVEDTAKNQAVRPKELPLADPADSDSTTVFRENEQDDTGKHKPSAYSQNKSPSENYFDLKPGEQFPFGDQDEYNRQYNQEAHNQWNEHKDVKSPLNGDA